jgi:serine/threonine protein kinase
MAFPPDDDLQNLIDRVQHRSPRPLTELVPSIPPGIDNIVGRALEKRPENRYQDLAAMAQDIARIRAKLESEDATPTARREAAPTVIIPPVPPTRERTVQNPLDDNVQFTVFRPKALEPGEWGPLLVFAHFSERRAVLPPLIQIPSLRWSDRPRRSSETSVTIVDLRTTASNRFRGAEH